MRDPVLEDEEHTLRCAHFKKVEEILQGEDILEVPSGQLVLLIFGICI